MHLEQQRKQLKSFPISSIPNEITSITANNNLIKRIPNITEYNNLKRLALNNNEIIEIDKSIRKLRQLSWLDLTRNKLNELPKEMEELNLLGFGLSENKFKEIPKCVLKMKKLQKFGFFSNYLIKIPCELFNLKELTKLDLSSNQLTEIPIEILNLKKLTWLNLSNNKLKRIPNLSALEFLEELGLGNNCLVELPFLTNKNLKILPIYRNKLKGIKIHLENIKKLDFSENFIDNPIIYAPNCSYLNLRNNKIKEFKIFVPQNCLVDLRENNLKEIPLKFYRLTKLGGLKFNENPFSTPKKQFKEEYLSLKQISLNKINKNKIKELNSLNNFILLINKLINKIKKEKPYYLKEFIFNNNNQYNYNTSLLNNNISLSESISIIIYKIRKGLINEKELTNILREYIKVNKIKDIFITEINKSINKLINQPYNSNLFIKPIISGDNLFKNKESDFNKFLKEFNNKKSVENIYFLFNFCQQINIEFNLDFMNKLLGINSIGFIIENKINYCDTCDIIFFGNQFRKNIPLINSTSLCIISITCCSYKCLKTCNVLK